jgi:ketosteroid isomerase-like protein
MSEQLCLAFMRDLEARDPEALRLRFSDDAVLWIPPSPPIQGARRIQTMFKLIFRMYTEIHWKVTDFYQVGERRYIYATNSWGTLGRDTPYKNHVLTVMDFDANGKISYLSDYFKDTAIFSSEKSATISSQLA